MEFPKNTNYVYCNNCGNVGHNYQNCKYPITSIGLIVFRWYNSSIQYMMIKRKDSLGFVEFMRGKYPINNVVYIQNIFNEMTIKEKENILTKNFDELWNELWGNWIGNQYRAEERISREKYNSLKNGLMIHNGTYDLDYFIKNSTTQWEEAEWGFPKGRRNYQEKDLNCALREFEEETGISKSLIKVCINVIPYEEIFTGSNLKSYKHKYFIGFMKDNLPLSDCFQKTEVSQVSWKTFEQCNEKIRPYNLEKKEILKKIHHVLKTHRLYS